MPCCAAMRCSNRREKGVRLFRFPAGNRKALWAQNMRRGGNWTPTDDSRLCEKHFEESQFESGRADNQRKLKVNAVPTLFTPPNASLSINPPAQESSHEIGNENNASENEIATNVELNLAEPADETEMSQSLAQEIELLRNELKRVQEQQADREHENKKLKREYEVMCEQLEKMDKTRRSFLNSDQIKLLEEGRVRN